MIYHTRQKIKRATDHAVFEWVVTTLLRQQWYSETVSALE